MLIKHLTYAHIKAFITHSVSITSNKITVRQYTIFTIFLLKVLAIITLQMNNPIVKAENTVALRSFALNGMFNIFVCVDGTQPHPNISTRMKLSKII